MLLEISADNKFLRPVDPIRDGCPTYFDEIKHPSDYQTIAKKTDSKRYKTMGELARDIELIFAKCVWNFYPLTSAVDNSILQVPSRTWQQRMKRCTGKNGARPSIPE